MTYNLSYDYCSLVVMGLLIFFYFYTPKFKNFQNRLYGWILICSFGATVFDVLSAGLFMVKFPSVIWINSLVLFFYQITLHALPALYFIYMLNVIFKDEVVEIITRKCGWITLVPAGIVELINLLSPITHWAYLYDENGYSRTWFFWVSGASMAFYVIACLVLAFCFKKRTGFMPKLTVIIYTGLNILFTYIQYLYPEQLLINSSATISIFSMYLSLQNPALLKQAMEDAEESKRIAMEANEAKSNFLANMSHEIRTPMNAIRGMTYLLETSDLKADAREYVNTIQVASENLLSLVNDILDISKLESSKMTLEISEYNMDELLTDINGMILGQVDANRIAAVLYVDPGVPKVLRGDAGKTKQIILNLMNNAVKFTDDGQIEFHVSARRKDDGRVSLSFRVRDTGIGIKDEDRDKLFEQFEQVDMAKNRKKEGTGLGLALVKSFCELMDGHVEVESIFGSGSTFTAVVEQEAVSDFPDDYKKNVDGCVYVVLVSNPFIRRSIERTLRSINAQFTIIDDYKNDAFEKFVGMRCCLVYEYAEFGDKIDEKDMQRHGNVSEIALIDYSAKLPEVHRNIFFERNPFSLLTLLRFKPSNYTESRKVDEEGLYFSSTTKIAIVDDNKVNLKVTSSILKKFGIEAKTLLSGYEMLDSLDKGDEYDLIFMDHMMPDMDGVETVKRIRAMRKDITTKVPIVALTANAVQGVEEEFLKAGMNDALFKPVDVNDLKNILVKYLPESLQIKRSKEAET